MALHVSDIEATIKGTDEMKFDAKRVTVEILRFCCLVPLALFRKAKLRTKDAKIAEIIRENELLRTQLASDVSEMRNE